MKKKISMNNDIIAGIAIIIFSVLAYYGTFDFAQPEVPWTAESFPRLVLYVMAAMGLIILLTGIFKGAQSKRADKKDLLRVAIVVAAGVVYLMLLPVIGFIPASIILLAITLFCYTNKDFKMVTIVSAVSPVIVYLIFRYLLSVRLP